jgi:hypothetical protein
VADVEHAFELGVERRLIVKLRVLPIQCVARWGVEATFAKRGGVARLDAFFSHE